MTTPAHKRPALMTTGGILAEINRLLVLLENTSHGNGIRATLTVTRR